MQYSDCQHVLNRKLKPRYKYAALNITINAVHHNSEIWRQNDISADKDELAKICCSAVRVCLV